MKRKTRIEQTIEVHSKLLKNWLVWVRGYNVGSRHREPFQGSFGGIHYKYSWILHAKHK
ncbi:MAG: hypothetical protein VCD00_00290 [Candidatus Hydrogenedentota bacterium]